MNEDLKAEKLQQITNTAQTLKFYSLMSLFFVALSIIIAVVFVLSKEITIEGVVNAMMMPICLFLVSGFLGQQQKGFEAIKALLEDKE